MRRRANIFRSSSPSSPAGCSSCSSHSSYSCRSSPSHSSSPCSSGSPAYSPDLPKSPLGSGDRATPSNPYRLKRSGHSSPEDAASIVFVCISLDRRVSDRGRAAVQRREWQLRHLTYRWSGWSSRRRQIRPRHPIPALNIYREAHTNTYTCVNTYTCTYTNIHMKTPIQI